jgi:phosphopentomutase
VPLTRAIVIVLDGVGIGELPDAAAYGDQGSNTLGNIARRVPLKLPTLRALGLGRVATLGGSGPDGSGGAAAVGRMGEASPGKDSVTGHWEMMGLVLARAFPIFSNGFSSETIAEFARLTGRGVLGNKAASGTAIIEELGREHMRTGALIVYTSADSVFQIAAHEDVVPLRELYRACEVAYSLVAEGLGVGRVIARPFVGAPGQFRRTAARRDYVLPPPGKTLLDRLKAEDLFAGRGTTRAIHTANDDEGMDELMRQLPEASEGLILTNLVDFDTRYGHRNDVEGYARNLEHFDARLGELLPRLEDDDLLIVTGDHGNDPTTASTDHSREYVPLLVTGRGVNPVDLGTRETFADLGQTLAEAFQVPRLAHGTSFLHEIFP